MLCPSCHTLNRDNAKFCKGCGQILAVEIIAAEEAKQLVKTVQGAISPAQAWPSDAPASAQLAGSGQQPALDPSLAPTEILSPEQMGKLQAQRWQRDLQLEQAEKQAGGQNHPSGQINNTGEFYS